MRPLTNAQLAYVLARIAFGLNFFLHGVVRLPKLQDFVGGMQSEFSESMLPSFLVTPTAYLIPIAELILGLMLLLGIFTRKALVGSALVMLILLAGCCLLEKWAVVGSQMVYMLYLVFLIFHLDHNRYELKKG